VIIKPVIESVLRWWTARIYAVTLIFHLKFCFILIGYFSLPIIILLMHLILTSDDWAMLSLKRAAHNTILYTYEKKGLW